MANNNKPLIAGWLDIVAGIIWLFMVAFLDLVILGFSVGFGTPRGANVLHLWIIIIALALPGVLSIIGGVLSLKHRGWTLALIGSICTIPLGLGIVAVVLLVQSKNDFIKTHKIQ